MKYSVIYQVLRPTIYNLRVFSLDDNPNRYVFRILGKDLF
jgi:hypothetical protein